MNAFYRPLIIFLALSSLFYIRAFGQGFTYNIYSGSDYYMYCDFNTDKFCDCGNTYSFSVWGNSFVAPKLGSSTKKKGKITMKIGPSVSQNYLFSVGVKGKNDFVFDCAVSCEGSGSASKRAGTQGIRRPSGASASTDKDYVDLRWTSNTDIPVDKHYYRIARDTPENIIGTTSGMAKNKAQTFRDDLVGPDKSHVYYISTVTDGWGGHTSGPNTVSGRTRPRQLQASIGLARKVSLTWDDISEITDEVLIKRNGEQIAEININSGADTAYSDSDPALIPGQNYDYSISWIKGDLVYALSAIGASQPNGRISGKIQTPLSRLPISGVIVCVTQESELDHSPSGTVYCDTTDEFGNYEIRRIYYGSEATYSVTATKENHAFDPEQYEGQRLELEFPSISLNFEDTTAFLAGGRIVQTLNGDTCGLAGVEIWINDLFRGNKTDKDGYYSLGVEESGTYSIEPRLSGHVLTPVSQAILIEEDVTDIDFSDSNENIIEGVVKAGCDLFIGQAQVRVYSGSESICFDTAVTTDTGGYYRLVLPARSYQIEVIQFTPTDGINIDADQVLSYFDTEEVDLTFEPQNIDFIFRRPPEITVSGIPEVKCSDLGAPVVEQYEYYDIDIAVSETFGDRSCFVESGFVIIYDEVGDKDSEPDTLFLEGGKASYSLRAGAPNLVAPYHKLLQVVAFVDEEVSEWSMPLLVTGLRAREQTFATVMPEIPFMILHDPPGDASYSFREEGFESELAFRLFASADASTETRAEVKLGSRFSISDPTGIVSTETEAWGSVGGSLEIGARLATQEELILNTQTVERFSTSGNSQITGEEGDLYIGAAMNMVYALADVLSVDPNFCTVDLSQDMVMGNDGFATTFMYTEDHINNSLIPQLQQIRDLYLEEQSDSAAIYRNQISVWQQVIDNNRRNKQKAKVIENRSFSAGAAYLSSTTIQSQAVATIETSVFIDAGVVVSAGYEVAGSGVNGSVETRLSIELGASVTGSILESVTTGFELNDDDQGDFFSVDIKEDPVYGTPVFDVVSGRSSCPKEAFTQPRESLQLQSDSYAQFDIPADDRAVFKLDLGNISQSDEPRTYLLKFLQESNPDGAIVTIGGSQAQAPIPYTIPARGKRSATITIERGARAFNYNNLQFILTSGCEDDLIADTVNLSVSFESIYPAIHIIKPNLTWTLTQEEADMVLARFTGFDLALLKKVQLQYAPAGTFAWEVGREWLPSALEGFGGDFTDSWDINDIPDGSYEIRYRADYGDGDMYSEIHAGIIDRQGPQLLGIPEPSDLELVVGDVISINFNENISCFDLSPFNVTMTNNETEEAYPVQLGCAENRLIIQPLWNLSAHVGEDIKIELKGITDPYGNESLDTMFAWSFTVGGEAGLEDNDVDQDGIENQLDNCSIAANPLQGDVDGDGIGDLCDDDLDGDGIVNIQDNCTGLASEDQSDLDGDGMGDLCDDDLDGDGILNILDNCPTTSNPAQEDMDEDGEGDVCDEMLTYTKELRRASAQLLIYPNPAQSNTTIRHEIVGAGNFNLLITDLTGRQVKSMDYTQRHCFQDCLVDLTVSNLAVGAYMITVRNNNQLWYGKLNIVR